VKNTGPMVDEVSFDIGMVYGDPKPVVNDRSTYAFLRPAREDDTPIKIDQLIAMWEKEMDQ